MSRRCNGLVEFLQKDTIAVMDQMSSSFAIRSSPEVTSFMARARFVAPQQSETEPMPSRKRSRLNDCERLFPIEALGGPYKRKASSGVCSPRFHTTFLIEGELVSKE